MIREVRSENDLAGEGSPKKCLIRRRLIPIELIVEEGEYLTFSKKLPHNTKKVVGFIVTSDTPWEDEEEEEEW